MFIFQITFDGQKIDIFQKKIENFQKILKENSKIVEGSDNFLVKSL